MLYSHHCSFHQYRLHYQEVPLRRKTMACNFFLGTRKQGFSTPADDVTRKPHWVRVSLNQLLSLPLLYVLCFS